MRAAVVVVLLAACQAPAPDRPAGHVGPVTGLALAGAQFASCSQGGVFLDGDPAARAPLPWRPVAIAALPDGALLVVGGQPGRSGDVALVVAGAARSVRVASDLLYAVAVLRDGTRAAVAGADGTVRVLALPSLDELHTARVHTAACRALAWLPDGATLASAGLDGVVNLLHADASLAQRLTDHTAGVEALAVSPDGTRLASGARDGKVRIHATDGRLLRTFARLGSDVLALGWRDPRMVLAGLGDGKVLALHDEGSGERRESFTAPGAVYSLVAGHGDTVVLGLDGTVVLMPGS